MPDTPGNPYVGPRSFETADTALFFGREDEVASLTALVLAHRAVLLYAASGTGKSSLLKAGLLPALRRDYRGLEVLPVARVPGFDPGDGLRQAVARARAQPGIESVLLVLDQFEEIFTLEPHAEAARRKFFETLGQTLREELELTLLLGLREDYLAHLDPYLDLFPDRLRGHFRLELLSAEAAFEAVTRPALGAGVPFSSAAARELVADLGQSRDQAAACLDPNPDGTPVDPVQLQVVCRRLWAERPPEATVLDAAWVRERGQVDDALAAFYDDRMAAVATETGVDERRLRSWVRRELITPQGLRKAAQREEETTAGLPNAAVEALENAHLLRAERRRGVVLYELAHDRLVEPVRESNRRWGQRNPTVLETWARAWEASPQADKSRYLLTGKNLDLGRREAESRGADLSPELQRFLATSQDHDRQRRRRWQLLGWAAAGVLFILLLLPTFLGGWFAVKNFLGPVLAAERARGEVFAQRDRSLDGALLAGLVAARIGEEGWLHRFVTNPVAHPHSALFTALVESPQLEVILYLPPGGRAEELRWTPDGTFVAAVNAKGELQAWEIATGRPVPKARASSFAFVDAPPLPPELAQRLAERVPGGVPAAASPDGRFVALAQPRGAIELWKTSPLEPVTSPWTGLGPGAHTLAMSPDGRFLASAHGDRVGIWQVLPAAGIVSFGQLEHRPERTAPEPVPGQLVPLCPGGTVASLRLPDVDRTVLGCANGELRLLASDSHPGARLQTLGRAGAPFTQFLFFTGTRLLAAGAENGEIWLWTLEPPRLLGGPLFAHDAAIVGFDGSPDGNEVISVSSDGRRIAWNLDVTAWKQRACRIANRNPTAIELESHFYEYQRGDALFCPAAPSEVEPPQ
ncbi:MAG: hypothetical protein SF066_23000 [Thermoanaerobaculia bacterium]|nr:hypothetical protein [Thermoanaerobaculia bacterium]